MDQRSHLAAIVHYAQDAIYSKTLDGIVTSWNHGAELLYGYTAKEMLGQPIDALTPGERTGEEQWILGRIKRGEYVEHFHTRRVRKDGKVLDISLSVSPVRNLQGEVIMASSIARDITGQMSEVRSRTRNQLLAYTLIVALGVLGFWRIQDVAAANQHETQQQSYENCLTVKHNHAVLESLIDQNKPQPIPPGISRELAAAYARANTQAAAIQAKDLAILGPEVRCSRPRS